jgi:2',3'-cyclic-nucleotide 2'-phosphodiesterase (5'-nucleotidase family)
LTKTHRDLLIHSKARAAIVICLIFSLCFCRSIPVPEEIGQSKAVNLVILHLNDTHGRLQPYAIKDESPVGGAARVATLIKEIRGKNPGRTLVLHAGDILSRGDALTAFYGGRVNLLVMEAMGFDAMTPGNGEFYTGVTHLKNQLALIRFPALMANVYDQNGNRIFSPYIIRDIAGIKVAVLGLGFVRTNHPACWSLDVKSFVTEAKEWIPVLRKRANLVIALTHIGWLFDLKLGKTVPGIDIIIGGHSHTLPKRPERIPWSEGRGEVVIVQAGDFYRRLGRMDVMLQSDENGHYRVKSIEGKLIPVRDNIREDKEITDLLERHSKPLSEVIGISKIELPKKPPGVTSIGELAADAMHEITGARVTFLSPGVIQTGIKKGEVTVADIYRVHNYRNRILEISLTGTQIQRILSDLKLFTAGCQYRIKDDEVVDIYIQSRPVDPNKSYPVMADEALLMSLSYLRGIPFKETGERVDTALMKYIKKIKVIEESTEPLRPN